MDFSDGADRAVIYIAVVLVTFIMAVSMAAGNNVRAVKFLSVACITLGLIGVAIEEFVFS